MIGVVAVQGENTLVGLVGRARGHGSLWLLTGARFR